MDEEMSKHAGSAQLHQCLVCDAADLKLDNEKFKTIRFGSTKWFWPSIFTQFSLLSLVKCTTKANTHSIN
jgi:hypothetical protein